MKPLFHILAALLLLAAPGLASAQLAPIDTTGGRYYRPVFANVTVTSNVAYGSATTYLGTTQQLLLGRLPAHRRHREAPAAYHFCAPGRLPGRLAH